MRCFAVLPGLVVCLVLLGSLAAVAADEAAEGGRESGEKGLVLEKVDRSFGFGWFRANGYRDSLEPRVSFVKRLSGHSEVIEYAWRPMEIYGMPHKERIDRVRCLYNRYYFSKNRTLFYGAGVGGNLIFFNRKLKDWAKTKQNLELKDGVNGLGRVFVGYKLRDFAFRGKTYPVVARVDGFFSPDYRFGGTLGAAGDRLDLTEIRGGINFSIE
jgi:hypothetical protein